MGPLAIELIWYIRKKYFEQPYRLIVIVFLYLFMERVYYSLIMVAMV